MTAPDLIAKPSLTQLHKLGQQIAPFARSDMADGGIIAALMQAEARAAGHIKGLPSSPAQPVTKAMMDACRAVLPGNILGIAKATGLPDRAVAIAMRRLSDLGLAKFDRQRWIQTDHDATTDRILAFLSLHPKQSVVDIGEAVACSITSARSRLTALTDVGRVTFKVGKRGRVYTIKEGWK